MTKLICGDCKATFEIAENKISIVRTAFSFLLAIATFGMFFPRIRRGKTTKKSCDYCGSTFILPDNLESRQLINIPLKNK